MWPLLVCSLASLTITLERFLFWWRESRSRRFSPAEEIFRLIDAGDLGTALVLERPRLDTSSRVLLSGLKHHSHGLSEGLEVAAADEVERMKRGLGILDTIITMAPLLGILGTVLGIIDSFDLLGLKGIADPRAVTGGIAQALITTASGLAVALLTLAPYNYLVHRVQKAAGYLARIGTRLEVAYRKSLDKERG